MEFIIIVAIIAVVWLVASGSYKTKVQDPQTLRPSEIEDSIIELKRKILITNAYEKEADYERLYMRLNALMGQVLARHQHFVLDVEAAGSVPFGFFQPEKHHDSNGIQYTTYSVPYDFDPSKYSPALLLYACFFLWHGGQAKDIGIINSNSKIMMKVIEFLVKEKEYGPALFMKGMVRKYGLKVYSECFPAEAKQLLEKAKEAGVGSAAIELENLSKYSQLSGIKSVQLGEPH
ncbi:MAG: hypothetical protein NTX37_07345 [Burkholderiales bacterium]|nr:hypothetical protein [Burkholderiales bacterium]